MANSRQSRPKKPWPSYPLFWHRNGQWCKKIRGKHHYFGTDADAAHDEYIRVAADLHAGRVPDRRRDGDPPTVKRLANLYLASQERKERDGINRCNWFDECSRVAQDFAECVGKGRQWQTITPDGFAAYRSRLYQKYAVTKVHRRIGIVKAIFKHARENGLITSEIIYGNQFDKPSVSEMRRHRNRVRREKGKKLFQPEEIHRLLDNARPQLRAMIWLGLNGGFYAVDCATLPISAVNLDDGIVEYERGKTGIARMVTLWPETTEAIKEILDGRRPTPARPEYADLVFLTHRGTPWRKDKVVVDPATGKVMKNQKTNRPKVRRQYPASQEMAKLLDNLGIPRRRRGISALRHTFRTWAGNSDREACRIIMGHMLEGRDEEYVEEIEIDRLRAVTDRVRAKEHRRNNFPIYPTAGMAR